MVFIQQALSGNLIIPDWKNFTDIISEIFDECKADTSGKVSGRDNARKYLPLFTLFILALMPPQV